MSLQGKLLAMIETVAEALGDDLCQQMVFVGGCSTAVLITDEITLQEVRATDDEDLIIGLTGMTQWMQLQETLKKKGFTVSGEDESSAECGSAASGSISCPATPTFWGSATAGTKKASTQRSSTSCRVGE